jgi:hypothetical protein
VADEAAGVHVGQRLAGEAVAFLFLGNLGRQCLFHDPATRAFEAVGQLVHLLGQRHWDVCGQYAGFSF